MSTMIMETMTIGPSVGAIVTEMSVDGTDLVVPVLVGPDIHDASRSKIIIKPRLKEYVKKQRAARRTLACFTSLDDPTQEGSESSVSFSSSTPPSTTPSTTDKQNTVKAGDAPKSSRGNQPEGSKQSIKVHSGRIKKSPKTASKVLAEIAKPSRLTNIPTVPRALRFNQAPATRPTPVAEPVLAAVPSAAPTPVPPISAPSPLTQRQPCTCRDPEACPYCRFLALANMFCAIVTAREQKLLMGK